MHKKTYHLEIDGLRVLAILGVVAIHTTTRTLEASSFDIQSFSFAFFINQIARFCVPLFFMISGFVLEANYKFHQSYVKYLQKRFSKIFIPYLAWSIIYYFVVYKEQNTPFLRLFVAGETSYQLYFIPTLLIFYILFPFIHSIYKRITFPPVLLALIAVQVALLYFTYYIKPLPIFYPLEIALLNYLIFIFGMIAARNYGSVLKKTKFLLIPLTILTSVLALAVFGEAREFYLSTHNYLYFYTSWRPSVLVYTISFAAVFYVFLSKLNSLKRIIQFFSRLSFFVFFVHVAVLESLWSLIFKDLFNITYHSEPLKIISSLCFMVCVYIVSVVIGYFLHKLPYLNKITG